MLGKVILVLGSKVFLEPIDFKKLLIIVTRSLKK
jgi:hypothetical protein